jgi:hypothetical protein
MFDLPINAGSTPVIISLFMLFVIASVGVMVGIIGWGAKVFAERTLDRIDHMSTQFEEMKVSLVTVCTEVRSHDDMGTEMKDLRDRVRTLELAIAARGTR